MSFEKCKRNVMGHYTTKPFLRYIEELDIKVRFGRLDNRPVSSRDGTVSMLLTGTYRYLLYMYADLDGLESQVKSCYRCLGNR